MHSENSGFRHGSSTRDLPVVVLVCFDHFSILRDRLSTLQREVTNKTERMVQRMRGVTGDQVSIKLDDLDAQLEDAFKKADSSKSGQLNLWQFC